MKDKIIIIGASGHGKVVADIAKLNGYKEILFLDDDSSKKKNGKYTVAGTTKDIESYAKEYDFIVGIGNNSIRKRITNELLESGITQTVLIHPSAVIDETVSIGKGTVVMAGTVINADSTIGNSCIINTAVTIDHDCVIKDYVHVSPGVHIAGSVKVEDESWLGIGSTVINNINISSKCIVGAEGLVNKDIEESGTYVGVPVKKIR